MSTRLLAMAAVFLCASIAPVPAADDPLLALARAAPGERACFRRVYDAAHLSRSPRQTTRDVVLSVEPDRVFADGAPKNALVRVALTRTDGARLVAKATCPWDDAVERDDYTRTAFPAFRGGAGSLCWLYLSPESAREGGHALIALGDGGRTLTLHLDRELMMRTVAGRGLSDWRTVVFGADDRLMRLDRAPDAAPCAGLRDLTGD